MMKDVMMGTFIKDGENIDFTFKTHLTTSEKASFVVGVTNALVGNNYLPVLRDVFFDYYIINMLTDIDVPINEKDESVEIINEIESFLEEVGVANIVKANIDDELIDELNKAIDENIEYRTGIHKNILNEVFAGLIGTIEEKLKDVDISNVDINNVIEMVGAFNGMAGDFTPQNIVNAYMNTNVAQQNIKELEESKINRAEFVEEMLNTINIDKNKDRKE